MIVAHAGHVLIDLPIFLGPVGAVCLWIAIQVRRDRREERRTTHER